jgi:hypothetical protein
MFQFAWFSQYAFIKSNVATCSVRTTNGAVQWPKLMWCMERQSKKVNVILYAKMMAGIDNWDKCLSKIKRTVSYFPGISHAIKCFR